jgi:hypothetical protein
MDRYNGCMAFMRRCRGSPVHALPSDEPRWPHVDIPGRRYGTYVPISPSPLTSRHPVLARLLLYIAGMLPMDAPSSGVHLAPGHGGKPHVDIAAMANGMPVRA